MVSLGSQWDSPDRIGAGQGHFWHGGLLRCSHGFSVNWGTNWGTVGGMTTVETTIDGQAVRLLGTATIPGGLIDTWETLEPRHAVFRTGTVVTVATGQEQAAAPFFGWESVYGYAVVQRPADEPVARFQEALRQAHVRHEERQSGARFTQVAASGFRPRSRCSRSNLYGPDFVLSWQQFLN